MEELEKLKLKRIFSELENFRGRHTELITIYIPSGQNINSIIKQIESEKSTASNIKSKITRKNVLDALEKIIRHLKLFKKTPKNGLAIFCGNISKKEGQQEIELWSLEPPKPLKVKFYRCDQSFYLDPLKEMLESDEIYGLIVLDRKEATFGLLEGKNITVLKNITSGIPGKFKTGGQSAARFERLREGAAKEFFRRIAEVAKELFFHNEKIKGLLIGGPGPTKENFLKEGQLVTKLKEKILAVKDIGYVNEFGLQLLVDSSLDILKEQEISREKKLLNNFFLLIAKKSKKVVYGKKDTKKALHSGAVEKLFLSSSIQESELEELERIAKTINAKIYLISEETREGKQFRNLGGYGAILRFPVNI